MSQKLVYLLMKELGGTAFAKQISDLARRKYPDATLYQYVNDRLRKLRKWGYIEKNPDGSYSIIAEYP